MDATSGHTSEHTSRRRKLLAVERHGRGGVAACTWALAGAMQAEGWDVALLSPEREPLPVVGAAPRTLQWLPRPRPGAGRVTALVRRAAIGLLTISAALVTRSTWVLLAVTEVGAVDAALVRILRVTGRRVVIVAHNVAGHGPAAPLARRQRNMYLRADAVVALSRAERDRLLSDVPEVRDRVAVIPHGEFRFLAGPKPEPSQARAELGLADDARVVLFYGRLQPYKGLDVLVDALAALDKRGVDVRAIVAGEPGPVDIGALRDRIGARGLDARVQLMLGYVPTEETPRLFAAADCVALPYHSATQSGVTLLAFGYGVPVVVSDVGGLAEYVDPGVSGEIASPGDPDSFADALERLLLPADALDARKRGLAADPPARFEWTRIARRFTDLLEDA